MRCTECEHCKSWVRYDESRFECARALSGFDCAFESRDGWKPKTYEELEKENAELKELLSLVYKGLISYKTNPINLAVEGTFEMEKKVFMDWLHRVKPYVTEGKVKNEDK